MRELKKSGVSVIYFGKSCHSLMEVDRSGMFPATSGLTSATIKNITAPEKIVKTEGE
jgi:hypothetical protein